MLTSSLLHNSARQISQSLPSLQMWMRHASSKRFEPVTIPYEALPKVSQTYIRNLEVSQRAVDTSTLLSLGTWSYIAYQQPPVSTMLFLGIGTLLPLFFTTNKQTIIDQLMTEIPSLSTNAKIQKKINQLMKAPYISIDVQGREITVSPVLNGDKIYANEIVIPSHMLNPEISSMREVLANAKTPEEAISAAILSKYLQGEKNPLMNWPKTSRMSIWIGKNYLILDREYATRLETIKVGDWKGHPDFPQYN